MRAGALPARLSDTEFAAEPSVSFSSPTGHDAIAVLQVSSESRTTAILSPSGTPPINNVTLCYFLEHPPFRIFSLTVHPHRKNPSFAYKTLMICYTPSHGINIALDKTPVYFFRPRRGGKGGAKTGSSPRNIHPGSSAHRPPPLNETPGAETGRFPFRPSYPERSGGHTDEPLGPQTPGFPPAASKDGFWYRAHWRPRASGRAGGGSTDGLQH